MYVFMLTYLDLCFHMPMCLDLCSLHALYYLPCACALHSMFVCLDLGYVCHDMCYCSPFVDFVSLSCALAYWFEPDLDPMVFVIVHTPWPLSKGMDHPILHVRACLLPCFTLVLASLVLGLTMFDTLRGFVVVWLHSTSLRSCLDVTCCEASLNVGLLHVNPFLFCSAR